MFKDGGWACSFFVFDGKVFRRFAAKYVLNVLSVRCLQFCEYIEN